MLNKGNLVNRIGSARRSMWIARCIAVVAISVAVVGWMRPVLGVIAERPIGMFNNDCMKYAAGIMCNN